MKTTINIGGMHCASCSSLIEKGVKKLSGIQSVSASMATNSATISFDEERLSFNEIVKQIEKLGYTVAEESNTHESREYLTKFIWSTVCTLPIATMIFVNWHDILGDQIIRAHSLFLLLAVINVLILGGHFHDGFVKKAKQGQTNMDTLISIGTLVALGYSVYAFVMTYFFNVPTDMGHFIMGASFIITFILLGKYFETTSKGQASQAIQKLLQLQEKEAIVLVDGKEVKKAIDSIQLEDVVIVRAGDKVPVDGIIISGKSDIDEAMLTGESIPVTKNADDEVYTGTVVINGNLHIKVTKTSDQTMLAKIIDVVNDAQANKPPIQHLVDTISSYFVWGILVVAIITLTVWQIISGDWSLSILYMISVIVIACPCAMGLATPVAIMVASGKGASQGVLIKSGEVLEKSQKIDLVLFDKTGTLTQGKPTVTDIIEIEGTRFDILTYSSNLSVFSHHPLSQAVVAYDDNIQPVDIQDFEEISGHGLKGVITTKKGNKKNVLVGNKKLLGKYNVEIGDEVHQQMEVLQEQGKTVNFVVRGKKIYGLIGLLDVPKDDASKAVKGLQEIGISVVMISGDTKKTVEAIAQQIGISEWHGEVLPDQKASIVKGLQDEGNFVAFVGDGINDAPALAQADLGIGIGQGSDIAIETADIVLVQGNPSKVLESIRLSRKTYTIIKQNLFRAFAYNTILIPIAALGLLLPMYASLAMSLSSVSVVLNSLRIKR